VIEVITTTLATFPVYGRTELVHLTQRTRRTQR
jgi:hypothetical protein